MAKKKKGWVVILATCGTVIGMFVGVSKLADVWTSRVEAGATQAHVSKDVMKAVDELEIDGCRPVKVLNVKVAVIETKLNTAKEERTAIRGDVKSMDKKMSEGFKEINTKQEAGFREVLEAINKKNESP